MFTGLIEEVGTVRSVAVDGEEALLLVEEDRPDLIILPGSKNTIDDLQYLKDAGMDRAINRCRGSSRLC